MVLDMESRNGRERGLEMWLRHGDCFAGETRIITSEGVKALADLSGQQIAVLGVGGKGHGSGWKRATVLGFGVQRIWHVTVTRYGVRKIIRTTAGHRWFVRTHHCSERAVECVTRDLCVGNRLKGRYGTFQANVRPSPFGIAHGVVFGDGTRPKTQQPATLDLYGHKGELLRYFSCNHTTPTGGGVRVWDLPRQFKDKPSLYESKSYLYGWLTGYFAADGCMSTNGTVSLSSADRSNIAFAEDVCAVLGITVSPVRTSMLRGFGEVLKPLYNLPFVLSSLREDFFLLDKHRQRFLSLPRMGVRPADWTVESVEETDTEENVYCAVVPDGKAFTLEHNIFTGNCLGADAQAHAIARALQYRICLHPPLNRAFRAFLDNDCDDEFPERPYLERNREIVDNSSLLIVCPAGPEEKRSGTWSTCRYARKWGVPRIVVWADGSADREVP